VFTATALGLGFYDTLALGAPIGDESQAFPMHGWGGPRCSNPCVAVERAKLVERVELLENDGGRMNSMGLHGEGGVFQNAVGFGGGANPSSARKRGTRERKGRGGAGNSFGKKKLNYESICTLPRATRSY
jgi:hypothetical protein